jgi:AraC-like DNA-binding protein
MRPVAGPPPSAWRKGAGLYDETYEGPTALLPELPVAGFVKVQGARPNYLAPDRHLGEYELHVVLRGRLRFFASGRRFEVRPGMAFITRPAESHWAEEMTLPPGVWYRLRFRLPASGLFLGLRLVEARSLRRALATLPVRLCPASAALREDLRRIIEEHRQRDAHSTVALRALVAGLLVQLIRDAARHAGRSRSSPAAPSAPIRAAIQYLDRRLAECFSVEEAAQHVGLSPRRFRERFRRETGFSPLEYLERRRVEAARKLLASGGRSVTEVAFALGFSSSAYFAAVFKRFTGQSPRQFRRRVGAR